MKTLFIIRHAKAETSFTMNDFERSLNERGRADAPVMAKRILGKKIKIDAFISSPAKRARKTAQLFAEVYGCTEDDLIFVTALYHAPAGIFYEVIGHLDDNFNSVALFAHNPGITDFVNSLVPAINIDNMPTCGIFAVKAIAENWAVFAKAEKEFLFFDYPKNI